MNNIQLTANFNMREFQCKDGSRQVVISSHLLAKLQGLRNLVKRPVVITSAYRNRSHNSAVGGATNSRHLTGEAADIKIEGLYPDEVAQLAESIGFTGIGIYRSFTHVDVRPTPARWNG